MKHDFFDYVRSLSVRDDKTLTGRALKTAEEVGELARAVLIYDTSSQPSDTILRSKILDEAVDTVLGALSTAYSLGFTNQEIEEMFLAKTEQWALKQYKTEKIFPVPFELVVSLEIQIDHSTLPDLLLLAEIHNGRFEPDLRTIEDNTKANFDFRTTHCGNNTSAYTELKSLRDMFVREDYKVMRTSIRAVMWHPSAPAIAPSITPNKCRFESELRFISPTLGELDRLQHVVLARYPKASLCTYPLSESRHVVVVHISETETYANLFNAKTENDVQFFRRSGFNLDFQRNYFVVFDTNVTQTIDYLIGL